MPINIPPQGFGSTHHTVGIARQGERYKLEYYCGPDAIDLGEGDTFDWFCSIAVTTAVEFCSGRLRATLQPGTYTCKEVENLVQKTAVA